MSAPGPITLSQLAAQIQRAVTDAFRQRTYWVIADVIDHKYYSISGHHYFTLAEKSTGSNALKAKIAAVAWNDGGAVSIEAFQRLTGQVFTSNINVLVQVSVNYHPTYGLQLALMSIDSTYTIGKLEQQRRQTLEDLLRLCPDHVKLVGTEYHTHNNSLTHAPVIQKVAVITSANAAGYIDFKNSIENNRFGYQIYLDNYFTTVQGEANAEAMCGKLVEIYKTGIKYDCVVIIRGGGSQSDLLIFDQFVIARAVAKFPIPIITGIGHQINETIVDLMAHTAVKTPSIAAEFIISHNHAFEDSVKDCLKTIVLCSQALFAAREKDLAALNHGVISRSKLCIQEAKNGLAGCRQVVLNSSRAALQTRSSELQEAGNRLLAKPRIVVATHTTDLNNIIQNLRSHTRKYLSSKNGVLAHFSAVWRMADPAHVLKRGFALIMQHGKTVKEGAEVDIESPITILMADTALIANVKRKTKRDGTGPDL